jgi:hypothetical protein
MRNFRIAFGVASCKDNTSKNPLVKDICKLVAEKLEILRALSYEQARIFDQEETEFYNLGGKEALLTIYKETVDEDIFIVVQVFQPTWFFPNYISTNGIGKLYAEGLVYRKNGQVESASDSDLWSFR